MSDNIEKWQKRLEQLEERLDTLERHQKAVDKFQSLPKTVKDYYDRRVSQLTMVDLDGSDIYVATYTGTDRWNYLNGEWEMM